MKKADMAPEGETSAESYGEMEQMRGKKRGHRKGRHSSRKGRRHGRR